MIQQYTNSYSSASADIQNLVANSVSILDQYILMQTGEHEYTALIKNMASKDVEQITVSRSTSSGYNNQYSVRRQNGADFDFSVSNEYYVFSNVGYGKSLNIPAYEGIRTYGITALTVLVFFMVVFKGALFKCLRR
jgi:hypothetical protein